MDHLYKNLNSWLLQNNWAPAANLIPFDFPDTGRGLMTLDSIKTNQVILKIPKSLLITASTVSQSSIAHLFFIGPNLNAHCALSMFLIYEKHLDKSSFWKPYLDTLPTTYTNPEFCKKSEKALLPKFLKNKSIVSEFKSLVFKKSTCDHCQKPLRSIFSYHAFIWAYYTVNTRAVYLEEAQSHLALAPFLDLFNHACQSVANAEVTQDSYQIRVLRDYDSEEQVFINYGAHNNVKLYLEYGFFVPNNPIDEIEFNLSEVEKFIAVPEKKSKILKDNMAFVVNGLNYNAKMSLFLIISDDFCEYRQNFSPSDLRLIKNLGLKILKLKKQQFAEILEIMTLTNSRSKSFSVAIELIQEFVNTLEKASQCLCRE